MYFLYYRLCGSFESEKVGLHPLSPQTLPFSVNGPLPSLTLLMTSFRVVNDSGKYHVLYLYNPLQFNTTAQPEIPTFPVYIHERGRISETTLPL